jgi:hypothetical protein
MNISSRLTIDDKQKLIEEGKQAPIWMYLYINQICNG